MIANLTRKWTLYVIHHSHTDIGYTDRQEKIAQYHADFIRQAIEASETDGATERADGTEFRWTCETFWGVEQFLREAGPDWQSRFDAALRRGDLELSATYLNMTELIGAELLTKRMAAAVQYGRSIGVAVDSAMTADINGFGWGYAESLANAGVKNLFTCIHTHHGMFPLGKKQIPFWWEAPGGERILVWNGEHYHVGNDLGLCPGALHTYVIDDGSRLDYGSPEHDAVALRRIGLYLRMLEEEGHPYDFVPVMVSGESTDNGPPNAAVFRFIREWNARYGDIVELRSATLHSFFETVRQQSDIPVFSGDWPDWWSDGVASTAAATQTFLEAQRVAGIVAALDPNGSAVDRSLLGQLEDNLMLYAEHTWGFYTSVKEPWNALTRQCLMRKESYAAEANRAAYTALDLVTRQMGERLLAPGRPMRFRLVNPHPAEAEAVIPLSLQMWERKQIEHGFTVFDTADGTVIPAQSGVLRLQNHTVYIPVKLRPLEQKEVEIKPAPPPASFLASTVRPIEQRNWNNDLLLDGVEAFVPAVSVGCSSLETPFFRIVWREQIGIVEWTDRRTGRCLLAQDRLAGAFAPVYEMTPVAPPHDAGAFAQVRKTMGRNRKGPDVRRDIGRLTSVQPGSSGPLFASIILRYEADGVDMYDIELTGYANMPRVDISVRIHKTSLWAPESLFIALPFAGSAEDPLYTVKTGAVVRPGIDQLPGTLTDYYCIQDGIAWDEGDGSYAIAMPDTPLLQLGPLEYGMRTLHKQQERANNPSRQMYVWALNNYWETNFKATVGGFYEFNFYLFGGEALSPESRFAACRALNAGLVSFRS
ncbi:MAG: glycoside hydrolase [Paenibacillaceae bacterium]|nr:glycoside hydrolase [Paenibacillaceae bacterium]